MARKKGRNRRRRKNQPISLGALQQGARDLTKLVEQARARGVSAKAVEQRRKVLDAATTSAQKDADGVMELFFSGVHGTITALDIVDVVLRKLYEMGQVGPHQIALHYHESNACPDSPVLRCEIRRVGFYGNAFVVFRTASLAGKILDLRALDVRGSILLIAKSRRVAVPGVGSAWRTSLDPGCKRWKIGKVQVGEKVAENKFCSFWSSAPFLELSRNCHVELNPVQAALAITLGREHSVLKATPYDSYQNRKDAEVVAFEESQSMLRFEIPFRSICDKLRAEASREETEKYAVYFPIANAPLLFRASELSPSYGGKGLTWDCLGGVAKEVKWIRTVDPTKNQAFSRARGVRLVLEWQEVTGMFAAFYRLGLTDGSRPIVATAKTVKEVRAPDRFDMFTVVKKRYGLSFRVRYLVDCVISLGTLSLAKIGNDFWEALTSLGEENAVAVLEQMLLHVSGNEFYSSVNDPIQILRECKEMLHIEDRDVEFENGDEEITEGSESGDSAGTDDTEEFVVDQFIRSMQLDDSNEPTTDKEQPSKKLPSKQHTHIRRLVYTPTRTVAQRPESDLLNRVLREYPEHEEKFIRVSFSDEDGGSLGFAASEDLYGRVREALRNGVHVAGERFVFLAFSNSQLRDHAAWFVNESPDGVNEPLTASEIRAWMGDFSAIRVPGKYAARQGQAFSSTVGTYRLDEYNVGYRTEVYDSKRKYMFSDGVGIISQELAAHVAKKLRLDGRSQIPSAFQIRFGGAKGMLAVWGQTVNITEGTEVLIRPSMMKFGCRHRTLEIVGYTKRLPLYLNRQIILLLSSMGVPDERFEEKQQRVLTRLDQAMRADGAQHALDLLLSTGVFDSDYKLRSSIPETNVAAFFHAGLTCASSEHLFNIMYAFRRRMINDLMLKARIPIDGDKGLCAIGIMDELGVLRENQIFCQYRDRTSGKTRIVTGRVIVGRSPCLHPGDLQQVFAVDCSRLHHLMDTIVFPKVGKRPIPSMLSGGDLDGDIFFCIFDPDITPSPGTNATPMDYTAPRPKELDREITTSDIADFFVEYVRNDRLGQIANAHQCLADKEWRGVHSEKCLQLANLHSIAVDFAKTSVPAVFPRELQPRNEPNGYPDFMAKHEKVSYKSTKVLGKLYRACLATQPGRDDWKFIPSAKSREIDEIIDSFHANQKVQDEADGICAAYNLEIRRIMNQFGVETEGEVLSGQVLHFNIRHAQLRGKREHFALTMRMNRQANELRAHFRDVFFKGLGQHAGGAYSVDTIIKACAWYKACRKYADRDRNTNQAVLVSFPWVIADVLLHVIRVELQRK